MLETPSLCCLPCQRWAVQHTSSCPLCHASQGHLTPRCCLRQREATPFAKPGVLHSAAEAAGAAG